MDNTSPRIPKITEFRHPPQGGMNFISPRGEYREAGGMFTSIFFAMPGNEIIPYNPKLKKLARDLRKKMTHAEVLLWQKVRRKSLGYQFHRQVPMLEYIVDFYCHELKLAIEVDGGLHNHPEVSVNDLKRQKQIEAYGVHFLRFDNEDIKQDIDSVLQVMENWIKLNA